MEAICSSETSVKTRRTTRHHIPEDNTLQKLELIDKLESGISFARVCEEYGHLAISDTPSAPISPLNRGYTVIFIVTAPNNLRSHRVLVLYSKIQIYYFMCRWKCHAADTAWGTNPVRATLAATNTFRDLHSWVSLEQNDVISVYTDQGNNIYQHMLRHHRKLFMYLCKQIYHFVSTDLGT
jgi:hypothetical protein